ncbi:MAG TPA: hypothetical protein VHY37_01540 [Tepidisphaeraceae bacterium]|nr:hypothetical protein [Tepidisphaeraceae bacterium]
MKCRTKISAILLSACVSALAASNVHADDAPTTAPAAFVATIDQQVAASASQQQGLKAEVAQAGEQLDAIIAEFDSNGMGNGQDVKTLKSVRAALSRLSGKQMDQVLALLQQARTASNTGQMKDTVAQAYSAQQDILLQMRQIIITCQEQTDLIELSVQFGQLADRQNKTLKDAKHFARQTNGNKENLNEGQKAQLVAQQADESELRDEVKSRLDKLATLVDQVDSATADQLSKVMTAIPPADLLSSLEDACVGLRQTNIFQAAVAERKARDQLREMARLVAPPRTPDEILSDAAEAVKTQIEQQKAVIAATNADRPIGGQDDVRDQLDDTQGDVVDAIDEVRKDIQPLATIPYDTLASAQQQMQSARQFINRGDASGAVQPETDSLATLTEARQELLDALTRAREAEMLAQSKLDQAKALQASLQDLRQQEEQAMAQAKAVQKPEQMKRAADKQLNVELNGQALQPAAAAGSPDEAKSLADALGHMDTAHQLLVKDPTPENAVPEQQKAIDALGLAQEAVDANVAELQKDDEEAKKLTEASAAVGKLITRQQQVQISTAIASARPAGKPADDPTAAPLPTDNQLADKQGQLKTDTSQVATTMPADVPDAATDLQNAQKSMADAQTTLNKSDAPDAGTPQQKAVSQLQDSKKVIDQELAKLNQQLDSPDQQDKQDEADEEAEEKIEQAKKAIAQGQHDLDQNKNDNAADQFKTAAELASEAENTAANPPPDAKAGLDQAQKDLAKGAADAAGEKTPAAQKDAAAAMADLTKSEEALQLADSGLAQAGPPGETPGPSSMVPNTPGKGDIKGEIKPMTIDANGARGTATGDSAFAGLPTRDRRAITQSEAEKIPAEYSQMIQQYMQNLAEGDKK